MCAFLLLAAAISAPCPLAAQPGAETKTVAPSGPASPGHAQPAAPPATADTVRTERRQIIAGPLVLDVSISRTANLFHVVDQISLWSEFCHRQYLDYFQRQAGGLSAEDKALLAEHARVRKTRGWGQGLEQTFYTPMDLEAALGQGVESGRITEQEARTELRVLLRFQDRVDRLLLEQAGTLRSFADRMEGEADLEVFAQMMARFTGSGMLTIPVELIANPDASSIGGGFNGGVLTLEIPGGRDAYPTLLHEVLHAFLDTRQDLLSTTADSLPGLDLQTLSEGIAYACNPGLVHSGDEREDVLALRVAADMRSGPVLKDSYPRFNAFGLALRLILKDSLDGGQTIEVFLPRALDAWRVLTELEAAHTMR